MAVLTATAVTQRSNIGDETQRVYTLSGNNGDTFVPGSQADIRWVGATPTTGIAVGVTVSGNTITFVTVGAWAASVIVLSRVG